MVFQPKTHSEIMKIDWLIKGTNHFCSTSAYRGTIISTLMRQTLSCMEKSNKKKTKKKKHNRCLLHKLPWCLHRNFFYQQNHGLVHLRPHPMETDGWGLRWGICNLKPSQIIINSSALVLSHLTTVLCTEHRSTYGPTVCYKATIGILFKASANFLIQVGMFQFVAVHQQRALVNQREQFFGRLEK